MIAIGNIVRLKGNISHDMLVAVVLETEKRCLCVWHDINKVPCDAYYPFACLDIVDIEKVKPGFING